VGLESYRPVRQHTTLRFAPAMCSMFVMAFGQGLEPFHKTTQPLLVPSNGHSLGGDGVTDMVQVCWVSHDQFVLSHFREDPDADNAEVTKVYYSNRGQAKRQVKARQRSVIQI
jgi:hypothetical protein